MPDFTMEDLFSATVSRGVRTLKTAVTDNAIKHGWDETNRSFSESIALIHSELSEALEAWRDGDDVSKISYEPADARGEFKPVGVASELADTIIRILHTCGQRGIPIEQALLEKHAYNVTRPFRHGGKRA